MAASWTASVWVFVAVVCLATECHGGKQKPTSTGSSTGVGGIFKMDKKFAGKYVESDLGRTLRVARSMCSMECQMNDKCKSFFYNAKVGCKLNTHKFTKKGNTKSGKGWNYFVKKA